MPTRWRPSCGCIRDCLERSGCRKSLLMTPALPTTWARIAWRPRQLVNWRGGTQSNRPSGSSSWASAGVPRSRAHKPHGTHHTLSPFACRLVQPEGALGSQQGFLELRDPLRLPSLSLSTWHWYDGQAWVPRPAMKCSEVDPEQPQLSTRQLPTPATGLPPPTRLPDPAARSMRVEESIFKQSGRSSSRAHLNGFAFVRRKPKLAGGWAR